MALPEAGSNGTQSRFCEDADAENAVRLLQGLQRRMAQQEQDIQLQLQQLAQLAQLFHLGVLDAPLSKPSNAGGHGDLPQPPAKRARVAEAQPAQAAISVGGLQLQRAEARAAAAEARLAGAQQAAATLATEKALAEARATAAEAQKTAAEAQALAAEAASAEALAEVQRVRERESRFA